MDQSSEFCGRIPGAWGSGGRCAYCGAPLSRRYYFCLACATPYKNVEAVLPILPPARPSDRLLIASKAPHVFPLFWSFVAVVLGSAVLAFALFGPDQPMRALLLQSAALLAVTMVFAVMHWPSLVVQLRRVGFGQIEAWIGLAALVPLLAINYGYHSLMSRQLGIHLQLPLLQGQAVSHASLLFFFCVFPAVVEEVAFRGLVQHWLQVAIQPLRALALASGLFMVLHFSLISAPYLFAVGMLLGWTKLKTGSLYPAMVIHFLHNLVVVEWFWR